MTKGDYQIPFDKNGNQLDYPDYEYDSLSNKYIPDKKCLRDNFVFEDTLIYIGYGRGRSSVTFYFKRVSEETRVSFFVSDFSNLINDLVDGKISGKFTFRKQGQNFGCYRLKDFSND